MNRVGEIRLEEAFYEAQVDIFFPTNELVSKVVLLSQSHDDNPKTTDKRTCSRLEKHYREDSIETNLKKV